MQKKNPKTHLKPKFLKALYRLENIRMKNSKKGGVVTDIQINTIIRGYIFKDIIDTERQNEKLWRRLDWYEKKIDQYQSSSLTIREGYKATIEELHSKFFNAVRSYNSLYYFGKIAKDMGVKMRSYNDELPENEPEFDPVFTQEVKEDGSVISKTKNYKKKRKK
jgi:hypothetical protein|tara:strand:- start:3818 stop:4309 length:492 start_codon:yes stop_codon:yes gene_type:complete